MKDHVFYTAEELSQLLKVSKQFIYNCASSKLPVSQRLPSIKIGRLKRFRLDEVLKYFEDHAQVLSV